ncbi:MAG: tyrosine-protein phosphatase, partial [Lachnospiraceae bacterium]|nr:tyrosine-protein phosphatase [Lachnospiraceae bacterium]
MILKIKRTISVFMAVFISFSISLQSVSYADEDYEKDSIYLDTKILKVSKEGDVILNLTSEDLGNAGFNIGDEVKVKIDEYDYSEKMPYFTNDSDSESDECALITDGANAALSTAKGSFALDEELFSANVGHDGSITWLDENGKNGSNVKVRVFLHEKGKYLEQYNMRNPERSNDRDDFSSGKKYANFRMVSAGTMGDGLIFRSSSPINDAINRNEYAAKGMEKAGVNTVINLSDNKKQAEKYIKESKNTYYKKLYDRGDVLALGLNYDFDSYNFRKGICEAVKFMSSHEAPYLIHCTEGKDRTGFLCALLEALMGASTRELSDDYLKTYKNFYNYDSNSEEYDYARKVYLKEIYESMAGSYSGQELKSEDFHAAAVNYLKNGGATDAVIAELTDKLKGDRENINNVLQFNINDEITALVASGDGVLEPDTRRRSIAEYSGVKVRPGTSSIIVNGRYYYNTRDYNISFDDNKHAGEMTAVVKFKKKTDVYKSGIKKMILTYTIDPRKLGPSDVKVRLNKKKTEVRSVRDLDLDAKVK